MVQAPNPEPVVPAQPRLIRRLLSLALLIAGASLLGYVGTRYFDMYLTQEKLETEWQHQASVAAASGQLAVPDKQALTRLQIPKIKLDTIVLEGVSRKQLYKGPGHMEETAMPGEAGNAVITAHRDTFFRHMFELMQGDEILVSRGGQRFRFQVTGKAIVGPENVSVIQPTPDTQLTLITCYPIHYVGPAPQRLVVFSKLAP